MNSTNKQKEAVTSEEKPVTKKKFSRGARKRWNKRLKLEHKQNDQESEDNDVFPITNPSTESNIVFNSIKHRTQYATRGLSNLDKVYYLEKEWTSVPISSWDRVSTKKNKILVDISLRDILIEVLIREARSVDTDHLGLTEIPPDFLSLIDTDIAIKDCPESTSKLNHKNGPFVEESNNKRLWVAFGRWLGLKRSDGPIKRKHVRQHLRLKWRKLRHALVLQNNKNSQDILNNAIKRNTRKEKVRLIISAHNFQSLDNIVKFRYLRVSECVTDQENRTLIHLEQLIDQSAVVQATDAVNVYYFHTLKHPSHRSDEFWTNFIEHFGTYTLYNLLPYTSSNTASVHNTEHQKCVDNLLRELVPLSNSINQFLREYYQGLYEKLSNLSWGTFAPRPFGVFPMIAINFNTISDYHWDEHDEPNSLCCLVTLGDFEGAELCFPQLQIIIPLRPGQVVAFSSRLLLHGNFPITRGIRHSIVYFVHSTFFHHLRDFSSIYKDLEAGIERDARGMVIPMIPRQDLSDARDLNNRITLCNPKKSQITIPERSCDKRRGNIDLSRARRGLKAEDLLPDGV